MTDGNTSAINKCLDEHEDYDALQEAATELWRAEKYHDAWLEAEAKIVELEAKLAKARENALREAVDHISHHGSRNDIYSKSRNDAASAILTILAELKGQE